MSRLGGLWRVGIVRNKKIKKQENNNKKIYISSDIRRVLKRD